MQKLLMCIAAVGLLTQCQTSDSNSASVDSNNESASSAVTYSGVGGQDAVVDEDSTPNILQIAAGSEDHTTLAAAVVAAELTTVLANNGPLTVFAPTNDAFNALPAGTVDNLLLPENKTKLQEIITFHAAPGTYDVSDMKDGQSLFVATGHNIKVEIREDGTYVHGAKILGTVRAANGIVHVVDKVLLPS